VEHEKLRIGFFDNEEDALKWLKEQNVIEHFQ
jgi:hypothetical protein